MLGEFKFINKVLYTFQQALALLLAFKQLLPCLLQCRVSFLRNLLSQQIHCLGFKYPLKTFPRFLLPLFPLLFVLLGPHQLLVRLALRLSVLQTSLFLLLLFR